MPSDETVTLDPVEFMPDREELNLDELGIRVREAEWGDHEIDQFLVRRALGEESADSHPPNRTVNLKLRVEENSSVSLAEAASLLQKKIGRIGEEKGFVKRVLDSASGFSGPVATRVHNIALGGLHGWHMAHRRRAPDVTLVMNTDPFFYEVTPRSSAVFEKAAGRTLEYDIADFLGSGPGLIKVRIKNEDAEPWAGLIHSLESRYMSADATAEITYEAENLTMVNGTIAAARTGGTGGANNVARKTSIPENFITILSSKSESGHMTHQGVRRVYMRVYATNTDVELRLEYRPLGTALWTPNNIVTVPAASNFYVLDMGECRPEPAVLGDDRWEWRLAARIKAEGTSPTLDIDQVHHFSTEQFLMVSHQPEIGSVTTVKGQDAFNQSSGALSGKVAETGGTWSGAGDADDFAVQA